MQLRHGMSESRSHFRVNIATLVSDASTLEDVVIHIDLQSALVVDQGHKTGQIARIKLAGVSGNGRGQVQRTENRYAIMLYILTSFGVSNVAAGGSRQIHDDRTRMHAI